MMKRETPEPAFLALVCLCALLVLGVNDGGHSAFGQGQKNQKLLKDIYEAYQTRENQLNPVWIKYTLHASQTAGYHSRRKSADGPDHNITLEAEFARKGKRTRTWALNRDPTDPAPESFRIYTGQTMISTLNQPKIYAISEHADKLMMAESPFEIVGEEMLQASLRQWMDRKEQIEAYMDAQAQPDAGRGLVTVELRYPKTNWKSKAWFMPEQGWTLHRLDVFNAAGEIVNACQAEEYADVGGIFIPKRGKRKHYLKGGTLGETRTFEVTFAETRADRIPDGLFQFDFPKDSQVWDQDRKVFVRNADLAESHLNEVVAQARPKNVLKEWLALGLSAGVLAIVVYLLIRQARAKLRRSLVMNVRHPGPAHGGAP